MALDTGNDEYVYVSMNLKPKPGHLDKLLEICTEGAKYHEELDALHMAIMYRPLDPFKLLEGKTEAEAMLDFVVVQQRWASMKILIEHGQLEKSVEMREKLMAVIDGPLDMTVGHRMHGFLSK